jgi:hypothetical protein
VPDSVKKINVPASILSELDWETGGYLIRYRILSENRNTRSHWSPVYELVVKDFEDVVGSFFEVLGEDGQTSITVVWDDLYGRPFYDIFVAQEGSELYGDEFLYDGSLFHFHGTSPNHNYLFVKREGATSIRIIVQPASNIKKIKPSFIIYDSANPLVIES